MKQVEGTKDKPCTLQTKHPGRAGALCQPAIFSARLTRLLEAQQTPGQRCSRSPACPHFLCLCAACRKEGNAVSSIPALCSGATKPRGFVSGPCYI